MSHLSDPRPIAWIQPGAYAYWVWNYLYQTDFALRKKFIPVQILEAAHHEDGSDPRVLMRLLQKVAKYSGQEEVRHDAPILTPMADMEAIAWEASQDTDLVDPDLDDEGKEGS